MIGGQNRVLEVGETAPDLQMRDARGNETSLSSFRGQVAVLAFFPDSWDPARPQQLALYNQVLDRVPGGGKLLGVSRDGFWCHAEVEGEGTLAFPLLNALSSDQAAADQFGVAGKQAVFVIDPEGKIRWSHVAPAGVHPTPDALLAALEPPTSGVSRRQFLVTAIAASLTLALIPSLSHAASRTLEVKKESAAAQAGTKSITLNINGRNEKVTVEPRVSLLDALRERLGMTGTKKGCDHGQCGACTVHINGRRVNSCLVLAMQAEGEKITTIEGLADGNHLHPVQEAFIKHDGFQCGYCTPGQIMSAVSCINEGHAGSEEEIKEWMSGNICRCGAYPGICAAIEEARTQLGRAR